MARIPFLVLLFGLLAACALEPAEPQPAPLPPPPPAPPRIHANRAAPARTPPPAEQEAPTPGEAPAADQPGPVWRVARDGVVGCADRAALTMLRQAAEGSPRLLAEARSAGGCRTTFRVNDWALLGSEGDAVRLRLTNGAPLTLWFMRAEVVAPSS